MKLWSTPFHRATVFWKRLTMADSVATVNSEPSTARTDDVLAGMDHAEVHYFNRCVKIAEIKSPRRWLHLVTITMVLFKLQEDFSWPITDGPVFVTRHTRGNAGTYWSIFHIPCLTSKYLQLTKFWPAHFRKMRFGPNHTEMQFIRINTYSRTKSYWT